MNKTVITNLKNLRKNKGWSQEHVADSLNLSQSTYARIESGESRSWAIHLMKICDIFEKNPEDLFKKELILRANEKYKVSNNALDINQLSEKLIEQYEERIKELKETIIELKNQKS
ncbi:helix-turn-helix transcriptional regulator [Flavobacterium psychrotolerans]|uniref:XRE family transcriptional regulator n=1 Tax=Flavobacterium psychrotolerans TaxID=2169410 RepID=A0A2U1JHD8_9FLAO|nr:helix-turn-helix transcriptional regulator [Flavobacterium psychrotolerans]PWA04435.1 XRE family transcriptional regulator [Flavobacterium psychrotolerans]